MPGFLKNGLIMLVTVIIALAVWEKLVKPRLQKG